MILAWRGREKYPHMSAWPRCSATLRSPHKPQEGEYGDSEVGRQLVQDFGIAHRTVFYSLRGLPSSAVWLDLQIYLKKSLTSSSLRGCMRQRIAYSSYETVDHPLIFFKITQQGTDEWHHFWLPKIFIKWKWKHLMQYH